MATTLRPTASLSDVTSAASDSERIWSRGLLIATAINCLFQVAWFWRFRVHNITMDGIGYIGIARHLVDGNLKASLHGYWSPLTSWIIAAASVFTNNFTLIGRLVTIGSFLLCLPLLYRLTRKLWNSSLAAALAVFWFSLARGLIALAVGSILADFVLTACVLGYFIFLLEALRSCRRGTWILVGAAHAVTFLAKAIAMPWLSISTVLAILAQGRSPRSAAKSLVFAFLFPALVWAAWGSALRTKYGQFTTGFQLRENLMLDWHRWETHHPKGDIQDFVDTSSVYDNYMVAEVPLAKVRNFSFRTPGLVTMIVANERQNVPQAVKEILILMTPGGALAFAAMLVLLIRDRSHYRAETAFACIAIISTLGLIAAYCMLVFDSRYVIPVVPLFIAIAAPALLPGKNSGSGPPMVAWVRKTALALLVLGMVFLTVYWASPLRTIDRDFEVSCYQAAEILRHANAQGTLVSIGEGPYPEHGVGFEISSYVAYLAGWRVVGMSLALPDPAAVPYLTRQALGAKSDAVLVWGPPENAVYKQIADSIGMAGTSSPPAKLMDPHKGEVGTLVLFQPER